MAGACYLSDDDVLGGQAIFPKLSRILLCKINSFIYNILRKLFSVLIVY